MGGCGAGNDTIQYNGTRAEAVRIKLVSVRSAVATHCSTSHLARKLYLVNILPATTSLSLPGIMLLLPGTAVLWYTVS